MGGDEENNGDEKSENEEMNDMEMVILAVLKWTERLGARRECTKDGWPTLLKSIHNRTVGFLEKACSRSVVHSEALSQLPESRLVIHQVMRADVTELKFIWLFCGYRERRQVAVRRIPSGGTSAG